MSGFAAEPVRADVASSSAHTDAGQRHDRIQETGSDGDGADISATQRMLSAVSGSLLTSLLITPLDVVRIRLQTQSSTAKPASPSPSSLATPKAFSKLPPSIGVTQCCREVFWVNNTSPICLAGASSAPTYTALNPSLSSTTSSISATAAETCAVDTHKQRTFTSTLDALRKIARYEGITSLWRGLSPTLVMVIPANVIYFTGYDALRTNPNSLVRRHIPDSYAPLVAGALARAMAAASISPLELLRTRMQASSSSAPGTSTTVLVETLRGMTRMVEQQGVTSLWRGLTLTMWRDVPFSGIYWWGYETMRNVLTDIHAGHTLSHALSVDGDGRQKGRAADHNPHAHTFLDSFVAGATSGAVASILTMPFDVGKTRQQVSKPKPGTPGEGAQQVLRPEQQSMPRLISQIWREEGMPGLFRGWVARTLKVAPACAIMISSYEVGKKMARRINEGSSAVDSGGGGGVE